MMSGLVKNHKKRIFKKKPELGTEEKYARFGFFGFDDLMQKMTKLTFFILASYDRY